MMRGLGFAVDADYVNSVFRQFSTGGGGAVADSLGFDEFEVRYQHSHTGDK
jgi:hypothetical protein